MGLPKHGEAVARKLEGAHTPWRQPKQQTVANKLAVVALHTLQDVDRGHTSPVDDHLVLDKVEPVVCSVVGSAAVEHHTILVDTFVQDTEIVAVAV